jgi:hypothetical protein
MSKRNSYILIIAILAILNLLLLFFDGSSSSSSFDDELFLIQDINSIQSINISNPEGSIDLAQNAGIWYLNETFEADQNFIEVLFSILNQVKVKRVLGEVEVQKSGSVTISFNSGESVSFDFSSDQIGTKSYFIRNEVSYQVEVPGYRDNVANIFELKTDQWKNRIVFDGSWRTIQNLNLMSDRGELNISFNNQFFEIEGVPEIDSTGIVEYLNQFQLFQANEMISPGRFPNLDSLKEAAPIAVLRIDDIKDENQVVFKIYPAIANQSYSLVIKNDQTMMVFDRRRIQSLLKSIDDFKAK